MSPPATLTPRIRTRSWTSSATSTRTTAQTFVLVTHSEEVGARADRIVRMRDGLIEQECDVRQSDDGAIELDCDDPVQTGTSDPDSRS